MEEVDNIIIHTLRQIGCNIPDDTTSLKEFTTQIIVDGTARCLRAIKDDIQIPSVLPASMSARFRLGTSLATACQEVGYKGEIGYQVFLYSNEADIRKLFMFLVEKLPKESSESASEPLGTSVLLDRRIANELSRRLASPWTPAFLKRDGICWRGTKPQSWHREGAGCMHTFHACTLRSPQGLADLTIKIPKETKNYYSTAMPFITRQPTCRHDVAPSVLETNAMAVTAATEWENEWNQSGLASRLSKEDYLARKRARIEKKIKDRLKYEMQKVEASLSTAGDLTDIIASLSGKASGAGVSSKGSRFTRTEKLQFAQDEQKTAAMAGLSEEGPQTVDTEEELQRKREEEIDALQNRLSELSSTSDSIETDVKKLTAGIQQTREQIDVQQSRNTEQEESFKVKKRTIDLLPDAENNIAKLQTVVDSSAQRLVGLAQQWEKHRGPLIEQYRELKVLNTNRVDEAQKKLEEIKTLRSKMKDVADDARGKEDLHRQLVEEYERMSKDVYRSAYTRRIMEIVGNIKKQKQEISKILIDTKDVQKDINQLSGKLDRTFTVTDELIFRDAKKDEACRKAYKYLASLHENCKGLIQSVEETGQILREIRDLEDQIDTEAQKNTASNLERITADFKQMKEENSVLVKKLKSQRP